MSEKYSHCIAQWDDIFSEASPHIPSGPSAGNEALDKGIAWVSEGTDSILDFGCGDGTMLFLCARNGTKHHIGIDLSEVAIQKARERAKQMPLGEYSFNHGSLGQLGQIENASMDAVILSNILDNLYPEDMHALLKEVARVLKGGGKLLVKLNSWVTPEEIRDWEIDIIDGDLLDDGMLLLNYTTEAWTEIFQREFHIAEFFNVEFPEYEQINRMFCLTKPESIK